MFLDIEGLFFCIKGFKCGNHNPGFGDVYENWKGGGKREGHQFEFEI